MTEALVTRRVALKHVAGGLMIGQVTMLPMALGGCNTTQWIDVVLADLPTALQAVNAILNLFGKGNIPPTLITQVQTDLKLVETLVAGYKTSPSDSILQKIDEALVDAMNNLNQILQAVHVFDPTVVAAITAGVGALIIVVTSIQALIPAPTTAPAARKALAVRTNGSPVIRASFDDIFQATGNQALAF